MRRRYDWVVLRKETSFVTLAAETQGSLPADFDRFANETMWNRTQQRAVAGPQSVQQWQADKAFLSTGIWSNYRIRGHSILFQPNPIAGDSVFYEYFSKYWVDTNADGIGEAETFTQDTQSAVLDEDVLTLGVVARLKEAKGLAYAESFRRFEHQMQLLASRDGSRKTLRLSGVRPYGLGMPSTPDQGFG